MAMTIAAAVAMALPGSAAAATSPAENFSFTVTSAQISVANLQPFTVDSSLLNTVGAKQISFTGTVTSAGVISVPKAGAVLPSVNYPVPQELINQLVSAAGGSGGLSGLPKIGGFDVSSLISSGQIGLSVAVGISAAGPATGTVSRETGQLSLSVPVDITIGANATVFRILPVSLIGCGVKGLTLNLTTNTASLSGGATLTGTPYSDGSKTATVAGVSTLPMPTCDSGLLASYAGTALAGLTGSSGTAQFGLGMSGTVALPPAAVASVSGGSSLKLSSAGSFTTKIACTKTRACRGTAAVAYPGGAVLASKSYVVPAGKTQTLTINLGSTSSKAVKKAMTGLRSMDAVVRLNVDWGVPASVPVKLLKPSSWR